MKFISLFCASISTFAWCVGCHKSVVNTKSIAHKSHKANSPAGANIAKSVKPVPSGAGLAAATEAAIQAMNANIGTANSNIMANAMRSANSKKNKSKMAISNSTTSKHFKKRRHFKKSRKQRHSSSFTSSTNSSSCTEWSFEFSKSKSCSKSCSSGRSRHAKGRMHVYKKHRTHRMKRFVSKSSSSQNESCSSSSFGSTGSSSFCFSSKCSEGGPMYKRCFSFPRRCSDKFNNRCNLIFCLLKRLKCNIPKRIVKKYCNCSKKCNGSK